MRFFQFLAKKPVNRLGYGYQAPEEIKGHPFFRALDWDKVENREEEPPIIPTLVRQQHLIYKTIKNNILLHRKDARILPILTTTSSLRPQILLQLTNYS